MDNLINAINRIISEKGRITLAIDGCCASGKTTLASRLAAVYDAQVIHMDDFFLPVHMRTEQRLSQAGGNVHYERFCEEVAEYIKNGQNFVYGIYDCHTGTVRNSDVFNPQKNIIIEGAYSFHPKIPDIYDLKVFVETDNKTQLERILRRNGAGALEAFRTKWIPFENKYFKEFDIKSKCDVILSL